MKGSGGGPDDVGTAPREASAGFLRTAALAAAVVGATGSVVLMLRAGQRNPSRVLILMFAVWVASPFVAFVGADLFARRWSPAIRSALQAAAIIAALVSLAVYGSVVLGPPRPKIARFFLLVPPASVLFAAAVVAVTAVVSRRGGGEP